MNKTKLLILTGLIILSFLLFQTNTETLSLYHTTVNLNIDYKQALFILLASLITQLTTQK